MKRPPSRLGRLLASLRETVGERILEPDADAKFITAVNRKRPTGLSRLDAASWITEITGYRISPEEIRRLETGDRVAPWEGAVTAMLTAYGLPRDVAKAASNDPNLNSTAGANPHLIAAWHMRSLAIGEFGPLVRDALNVGDWSSTWVEVEKASSGGFSAPEVQIDILDTEVRPPAPFTKLANDVARHNAQRIANGERGWTDNPTLSLRSVTAHLGDDEDERNGIALQMQRSWYRYNVVAKQSAAAEYRWRALQAARAPLKPVDFLASGVGICINVRCDGGRSLVIGQRSSDETFRKGEYDIAVVEGIRPSGDVRNGAADIHAVARRALEEELGLHLAVRGRGLDDVLTRLVIFELGCDLEYYQWNFLAFADVALEFRQVYDGWKRAKDRKENQTLHRIACDETAVTDFVSAHPIWSSGIACALRTFDYLER